MMKYFAGFLIFVILFLFFLPTILSISAVHQFLLSSFASSISVQRIELSWFRDVVVEGVVIKDDENRMLFTSGSVVHHKPLLSWFTDPHNLGIMTLQKPTLWLYDTHGDAAITLPKKEYTFTVVVVDGAIQFSQEKISDLHFTIVGALRDGKLFLNKPLEARFALRHAQEITLTVDDKGFVLPLVPFSLKDVAVSALKVDPGIITVKNVGFLATIISFLKFRPSSNGEVSMWFTPLYLEMKDGLVTCNRTDILVANTFPVALWGTVDLVKDSVDMTLGLSSQALRRAFALLTLRSSYFLLVPIRGTVESPRANTALVTTRITALRLQETLSPTSIIFGSLLGFATNAVDNRVVVPPPTTTPFPWSQQ